MRILIDPAYASLSVETSHGNGQRVAEIASVLDGEHDVRIACRAEMHTPLDVGGAEIVPVLDTSALTSWCDAVLFFDSTPADALERAQRQGCHIVSECRPPIEQFDFPSIKASDDAGATLAPLYATFVRQVRVGDAFVSRSSIERTILATHLVAAGRVSVADIQRSRFLHHLVFEVPNGYTARSRDRAAAVAPMQLADFLWTGGMWDFFRPELFVEAIAELRRRGVATTGAFLHAAPIADTAATIARVADLVARLGLDDVVQLVDRPLDPEERNAIVRGADALVCISSGGLENETTVRMRVRDTLLHRVPLIVDSPGGTAALVRRHDLGIALEAPTSGSLADAMALVLRGKVRVGETDFALYETTLQPLLAHLREVEERRGSRHD